MKLSDLRKLAVKKKLRVRFRLPNGLECVMNEHGIAELPALKAPPDFNLEEQFASVSGFIIEPVAPGEKQKAKAQAQNLTRDQLSALAAPAVSTEAHAEDD